MAHSSSFLPARETSLPVLSALTIHCCSGVPTHPPLAMAFNRLILSLVLVLAITASTFACSVPFGSCTQAKCKALATVPGKNDPKMGFYQGIWNNVSYPKKADWEGKRGGPFVNFEVFVVRAWHLGYFARSLSLLSAPALLPLNSVFLCLSRFYPAVTIT